MSSANYNINIIIVAAGSGLRFGAPLPKQFCNLAGRPVVMHTIDALRHAQPDANIILVINRDMNDFWLELCKKHHFASPLIVFGGNTRWESVRNALDYSPLADIVLIHDAVRPLIASDTVSQLIAVMSADDKIDGAIPAIPVTDSLRQVTDCGNSVAVDRSVMRAVQTPQAFRYDLLRNAYAFPYRHEFTDDASVMEAAGYKNIVLTQGQISNIKITNPGDIEIAETLLKHSESK